MNNGITRERAAELLPVITAWAEGKDIQIQVNGWQDVTIESLMWNGEYRIKPEPVVRWAVYNEEAGKIRSLHTTLEDAVYYQEGTPYLKIIKLVEERDD